MMGDSVITTLPPLVTVAAHEGMVQTAAPAPAAEAPRKRLKGGAIARRAIPSAVVSAMSTTLGAIAAGAIAAESPSTSLSGFTGFAGVAQCIGGIVEFVNAGVLYDKQKDWVPMGLKGFGDLLMGVGLIAAANGLGYPSLIPILGGVVLNLTGSLSTPKGEG